MIDTEPAHGDVYKMLLGSVVENYDGEENGLELVESPESTQGSASSSTAYPASPSRSTHTSPSSEDLYMPPARMDTDLSQQTLRPRNSSQNQGHMHSPTGSSRRNRDGTWPR